jgi:O-acetyl-ADP-ribose deacetylase
MKYRTELIKGDITKIACDAVVNAANRSLLGGGGVDGAIHRAAGKELLEACRLLNGCETGEAKITPGFSLPAGFVIHTVGPVWNGGQYNEEELLSSCYKNSLAVARQNNCRSVAFPNISTGIYGFPKEKAAAIAINTVVEILNKDTFFKKVMFVCFDEENHQIYHHLLNTLLKK